MFEMMTSGLHYMCVEQELAFNATIECIDREAGLVQSGMLKRSQNQNIFDRMRKPMSNKKCVHELDSERCNAEYNPARS